MKCFNKIIFLCLLILAFNSSAQWNILTGYDFGSHTNAAAKQKGFNYLHRININNEYIFIDKITFSLNSGVDFHQIDYKYNTRMTNPSGNSSREYFYSSEIDIQNFRLGFSLGYLFNINDASSIHCNFSYDQYFVNNVSIKESYIITNLYDVPSNEIDNNEPNSSSNEFFELIDLSRFGYKNRFLKENRNIIFSLGYRYRFDNFFISPSIGFSPRNHGFILSTGQNLFLFGVNFGYTLPQKSKNDEK